MVPAVEGYVFLVVQVVMPVADPAVTETAVPVTTAAVSMAAAPVYVDKAVTKLSAVLVMLVGANSPDTVIVMVEEAVVTSANVLTVTVPADRLQVTVPPVVAGVSPVTEQLVQEVPGLFQFELSKVIVIVPLAGMPCCRVKLTVWAIFTPSGPRCLIVLGDMLKPVIVPTVLLKVKVSLAVHAAL